MKPLFLTVTFLLAATFTTLADGLEALQGRWTAKKSGQNGPITQTLEFKKEKWTFKVAIQGGSGFVAEGDAEFKKAGVFDMLRFHVTKFGPSETELGDADDERNVVLSIQNGKLYIANNLDQQRENENPIIDVYSKTADAAKSGNEIVGTWKLDLQVAETKYDYTVKITENGGNLSAALVSPRSGEHKAKSVSFENNTFKMELDRELENNPVVFAYSGKLEGNKLSGNFAIKREGEEIATGTWEAKK